MERWGRERLMEGESETDRIEGGGERERKTKGGRKGDRQKGRGWED